MPDLPGLELASNSAPTCALAWPKSGRLPDALICRLLGILVVAIDAVT